MRRVTHLLVFAALSPLCLAAVAHRSVRAQHVAAAGTCPSSLVDGYVTPTSKNYIYPRVPVQPFYQFEANNGYCGEVSVMSTASALGGTWMSQYNARAVCGASLSLVGSPGATLASVLPLSHPGPVPSGWHVGMPLGQSGPPGWCLAFGNNSNFNSQVSYEKPGQAGLVGSHDFASAQNCLANVGMYSETYAQANQPAGLAGFKAFVSWIKAKIIAGNYVSIGVIELGGGDPEYDHEVTITKVGTEHDPSDSSYHDSDVLHWEDHGVWSVILANDTLDYETPALPPGAADNATCTPFLFGYRVADLPATRSQANAKSAKQQYHIIVPGAAAATQDGGDGYSSTTNVTTRNLGFASGGLVDPTNATLLVSVSITDSSFQGAPNPADPICGFNYESPNMGSIGSCTTTEASPMKITLEANVSGLTPGVKYILYEYVFAGVSGVGPAAALAVPASRYNANKKLATNAVAFTAAGATYTHSVDRLSSQVVVFRCVAASAA